MKQKFNIVNIEKRQALVPDSFCQGLELPDWYFSNNPIVNAMENLMAGDWRGDHVYMVGELALPFNPNLKQEKYYESLCWARTKLRLTSRSLYEWSLERCEILLPKYASAKWYAWFPNQKNVNTRGFIDTEEHGFRFLVNRKARQFIDLKKCPKCRGYTNKKVAPLPLLIAMGNGEGDNEYSRTPGQEFIGSWCETSDSIEITDFLLDDGLEEIRPGFS